MFSSNFGFAGEFEIPLCLQRTYSIIVLLVIKLLLGKIKLMIVLVSPSVLLRRYLAKGSFLVLPSSNIVDTCKLI